MKKVLLALSLVLLAGSASAHGFYGYHGCCYRGGYGGGWVAPAIIGGVNGYEIAHPAPVVVQPPVIVQQPPVVVQQSTYQAPPPGYHWQDMIDPQTNTHKIVLVPNQ